MHKDLRKERVEVAEANIDEMSQLAEKVVNELHFYYQCYDVDGRRIIEKYREWERMRPRDYKKLKAISNEEPNAVLLFNLLRRRDDFNFVCRYTKEDIIPWVEPIIPKALWVFRNGEARVSGACYLLMLEDPDSHEVDEWRGKYSTMMILSGKDKKFMRLVRNNLNGSKENSKGRFRYAIYNFRYTRML